MRPLHHKGEISPGKLRRPPPRGMAFCAAWCALTGNTARPIGLAVVLYDGQGKLLERTAFRQSADFLGWLDRRGMLARQGRRGRRGWAAPFLMVGNFDAAAGAWLNPLDTLVERGYWLAKENTGGGRSWELRFHAPDEKQCPVVLAPVANWIRLTPAPLAEAVGIRRAWDGPPTAEWQARVDAEAQARAFWRYAWPWIAADFHLSPGPAARSLWRRHLPSARNRLRLTSDARTLTQMRLSGGHGLQQVRGTPPAGAPTYGADLNAAYSAAAVLGLPLYADEWSAYRFRDLDGIAAHVRRFPASQATVLYEQRGWEQRIGWRDGNKPVNFGPGRFWATLCGPELQWGLEHGRVLDVWRGEVHSLQTTGQPFRAFLEYCYAARNGGGPWAKVVPNALMGGFFGQGGMWQSIPDDMLFAIEESSESDGDPNLEIRQRFGRWEYKLTAPREGFYSFPFLWALIAARVRFRMAGVASAIERAGGRVWAVYTDSLYLDEAGYMALRRLEPVGEDMGEWKVQGPVYDASFTGREGAYTFGGIKHTPGQGERAVLGYVERWLAGLDVSVLEYATGV